MTLKIERHVFGSRDGYQTLAHSPGLSTSECKALQGFAFGTPYDPTLRASLARNPAYWSRPVGPHKRSVTRVMIGEPDDAGRPTLLFLSAVVSAGDWDQVLQGDAAPLLRIANLWRWDPATPLDEPASIPVRDSQARLSGQSIQRVLGLLSLLEQAWTFRRAVVVAEDSYSFEEVLMVERLLPPSVRRAHSAVYRGINCDMPVSLNCLARSVPAASGNPFRSLATAVSPYAKLLAREGLLEGRIPSSFIRGYQHFSKPVVEALDDDTGSESMMKLPGSVPTTTRPGLVAALVAPALILGAIIGWLGHQPPLNPWHEIAAMAIQIPLVPSDDQVKALTDIEERLGKLPPTEMESDDLKSKVEFQRKIAEQARKTNTTLSKITRGSPSTLDHAAEAVGRLGNMLGPRSQSQAFNDHLTTYRRWLDAESRRETQEKRANAADKREQVVLESMEALRKSHEEERPIVGARSGQPTNRGGTGTPDNSQITVERELQVSIKEIAELLKAENHTKDERDALVDELRKANTLCVQLDSYGFLSAIFSSLGPWIEQPLPATTSAPAQETQEEKAVREAFEECREAAVDLAEKKRNKVQVDDLSEDRRKLDKAKRKLTDAIENLAKL